MPVEAAVLTSSSRATSAGAEGTEDQVLQGDQLRLAEAGAACDDPAHLSAGVDDLAQRLQRLGLQEPLGVVRGLAGLGTGCSDGLICISFA